MKKVYKAILKKKRDQAFWEDETLFITASSFAEAENKAYREASGELITITLIGETTGTSDVIKIKGRDI